MRAPWEHHNEKRTITAYQCQQLNLMVIEICDDKVKEDATANSRRATSKEV